VRYAKLATRGFGGGRSVIARVFERGWIRQLGRVRARSRSSEASTAVAAATGVLLRGTAVAGPYSGSVLPRFRGPRYPERDDRGAPRGGWRRGHRVFYSMTDLESMASMRNLKDEGFRKRFEVHLYERKV
jgi:hypothetical protein